MARRWQAVLGRLGTPTGDGRIISPGGLTSRDLPLPLSWQRQSDDGHGGSVVVGRIETIEFHQDMVTATGSMIDNVEALEAGQLIDAEVIGPSMDLDDITYVVDDQDRTIITNGRIAGATLVAIPAFAEVSINLAPEPAEPMPEDAAAEEWLFASVTPQLPPVEAFTRPTEVAPIQVTEEPWGKRVFGYVATWGTCHVGLPGCTTAPASHTDYAHFLRKEQPTADGTVIPVGVLTVGGGHAAPDVGVVPALEHYDNVGTAVARVFAGEDEHGIWVSGWAPDYVDPGKLAMLADLDVSGDWRRIGGNLELIAVCAVNTPGFPVLRKVHFSMDAGGQACLIGQFNVKAPAPGPVADSEARVQARAAWARRQWMRKADV